METELQAIDVANHLNKTIIINSAPIRKLSSDNLIKIDYLLPN